MCVGCGSERNAATANGEEGHGGVGVKWTVKERMMLLLEPQMAEMVGATKLMHSTEPRLPKTAAFDKWSSREAERADAPPREQHFPCECSDA